jgi:hypothetical protein
VTKGKPQRILLPTIRRDIEKMFPHASLRFPVSKMLHQGRAVSAYLRNTAIVVDGKRYHAIVVANVDIAPHKRGKGYFRELCTFVESFAIAHPFIQVIQHECVLNPDVAEMHLKHGYDGVAQAEGLPWSHYYKWAKSCPTDIGLPTIALDVP